MDQTAREIREKEEQSPTNETPDLAGDGGGGDDDVIDGQESSGSSLPVPSINRRHLAVIAVVVGAVIAWKLYQQQSSSAGNGTIAEEREKLDKSQNAKARPDDEEGELIDVPIDPSDPLAADRAVTEALRSSGKLHDPDQ